MDALDPCSGRYPRSPVADQARSSDSAAHARISGYLRSMPALGHNPLVAIPIALVGHAAATVEQPYGPTSTEARAVTIRSSIRSIGNLMTLE